MRNIAKDVSNGTRLVVTYIDPNLTHIKARVLSERGGLENEVFIARLRLTVNMGGYLLERTQLPIRLAYVMTIHKSQGLTLKKVGLYLNASVFAHGQLYVGIFLFHFFSSFKSEKESPPFSLCSPPVLPLFSRID
jgi:hypothetical protein